MADKLSPLATERIATNSLGIKVDTIMQQVKSQRRNFERRWYDNNFFDDGYHFRFISRTTGKIVDLSEKSNINLPTRAIPKASRQIRGIANLLLQPDLVPVIYPERISKTQYQDPSQYQEALQLAKTTAQKTGHWMTEEWKNQHLIEKLMHMVILTAKHGVSFLQVWPDAVEEKIKTQIWDAFDIYTLGNINELSDEPFIIKAVPQLVSILKANENFNEEALAKITPDNKYASSEIKQAYMTARFGTGQVTDQAATLIEKEVFIKEYLSDYNWQDVIKLGEKNGVMEGKKKGDMVMRHAFAAGGVTLLDEYINLPDYPFVDFRMEPGPMYQTPLIERFTPANKTLDIITSRVERYINTMTSGTWLVGKGENMEITNIPGGQQLEYTGRKPEQAPMAPIPSHVFNFMAFMEKIIDEQGASASTLNQLPDGVKSGRAIESVKQTEYANLKIASNQLKQTVRGVSEKMLDVASNFLDPQTVYLLDKGEPSYFDIIGQSGIDARTEINKRAPGSTPIPDAIPIKKGYRVDIQTESGLGFTEEGRKDTLEKMSAFIQPMIQQGLVTQDFAKALIKTYFDQYGFGAMQDLMESLDSSGQSAPLNEDQITQMKIAVVEAMKDAGVAGVQPNHEEDITKTKIGTLEALQESGLADKINGPEQPIKKEDPPLAGDYKEAPDDIKRQIEQAAGYQPSSAPKINSSIPKPNGQSKKPSSQPGA